MNINKIFNQYDKLTPNQLLKEIGGIVLNADDFIIYLQQKQLSKGLDSDGEEVGRYKPLTQIISENPQDYGVQRPIKSKIEGELYNFEWSGSFFKSMKIKVSVSDDLSIEIESLSKSSSDLQKKFKKLLGLTKSNEKEFIEFLNIEIIKLINKTFR